MPSDEPSVRSNRTESATRYETFQAGARRRGLKLLFRDRSDHQLPRARWRQGRTRLADSGADERLDSRLLQHSGRGQTNEPMPSACRIPAASAADRVRSRPGRKTSPRRWRRQPARRSCRSAARSANTRSRRSCSCLYTSSFAVGRRARRTRRALRITPWCSGPNFRMKLASAVAGLGPAVRFLAILCSCKFRLGPSDTLRRDGVPIAVRATGTGKYHASARTIS